MKRFLFFASIFAGLFLAASCQQENLEPVANGNTVTYTIEVPTAIATKALGDNVSNVTELHYEVWRTADAEKTAFTEVDNLLYHRTATLSNDGTTNKATITLELINDQNFTVLFWAQVPGNEVYTVTDLTNVTVAQSKTANQESYAAFSGVDFIEAGESLTGRTISLKRAVAQLNIATTNASLGAFDEEVELNSSSVTVEGLSTSFNVATQDAGTTQQNCQYAPVEAPATDAIIGTDFDTDHTYVAMNYVGFVPASGTNVKVSYVIGTSEGTISNTIENVPVKANYRTNIIGNLITSKTDYTVSLNADWGTPANNVEVVTVSTATGLQEAINNIPDGTTGNIKLEGNIDLSTLAGMISTKTETTQPSYGLLIPAGKSVILDLNGITLAQELACTAHYAMIQNNGSLTILDGQGGGKISFKDTGKGDAAAKWGAYTINTSGTLVVKNVTIENLSAQNIDGADFSHMVCAIQQASGSVTIEGGLISTPHYRSLRVNRGELVINGGEFDGQIWMQPSGDGTSITINGGQFSPNWNDGSSVFIGNGEYEVNVSITGGNFLTKLGSSSVVKCVTGGTFAADPSAYVADAYVAVKDGEIWKIEPIATDPVVQVGENKYHKLQSAFDAVKDGETITLLDDIVVSEYLVAPADINATLDLNGHALSGGESNYILGSENGSILTINATNGGSVTGRVYIGAGSEAIINGGTYNAVEGDNFLIMNSSGKLTINNATINASATYPIYSYNDGNELVINDATINATFGCVNVYGANSNVTINGGTFKMTGVEGNSSHIAYFSTSTTAVINGGSFEKTGDINMSGSGGGGVCVNGGANLTIKGGSFSGDYSDVYCWDKSGEASISIEGGTFKHEPEADFIADGYTVTQTEGKWIVEELPGVKTAAELKAAIEAGGEITLAADITLSEMLTIPAGTTVTLDLNGKTITSGFQSGSDSKHIYPIDNYGNLTIKDVARNGSINGRGIYNRDAATLTIESVKVVGQDWNGGACVWSYGTGEVYLNDATLIGNTGCVYSEGYVEINGGAYTCYSGINDNGEQITSPTYNIRACNGLKITDGTFTSRHGVIYIGGGEALLETGNFTINFAAKITSNVLYATGKAQVTVNGGNYISDDSNKKADSGAAVVVDGSDAKVDIYGGTFIGMNGMVSGNTTLYGGTFNTVWDYNHYDNIKDKLAEGYGATQNADGSWTVAPSSTEN